MGDLPLDNATSHGQPKLNEQMMTEILGNPETANDFKFVLGLVAEEIKSKIKNNRILDRSYIGDIISNALVRELNGEFKSEAASLLERYGNYLSNITVVDLLIALMRRAGYIDFHGSGLSSPLFLIALPDYEVNMMKRFVIDEEGNWQEHDLFPLKVKKRIKKETA